MSKQKVLMKQPVFNTVIHYLKQRFSALPDRRVGHQTRIAMADVGLSREFYI